MHLRLLRSLQMTGGEGRLPPPEEVERIGRRRPPLKDERREPPKRKRVSRQGKIRGHQKKKGTKTEKRQKVKKGKKSREQRDQREAKEAKS